MNKESIGYNGMVEQMSDGYLQFIDDEHTKKEFGNLTAYFVESTEVFELNHVDV